MSGPQKGWLFSALKNSTVIEYGWHKLLITAIFWQKLALYELVCTSLHSAQTGKAIVYKKSEIVWLYLGIYKKNIPTIAIFYQIVKYGHNTGIHLYLPSIFINIIFLLNKVSLKRLGAFIFKNMYHLDHRKCCKVIFGSMHCNTMQCRGASNSGQIECTKLGTDKCPFYVIYDPRWQNCPCNTYYGPGGTLW